MLVLKPKCAVHDCENRIARGDLCFMHYMRQRRTGELERSRRSKSEGVICDGYAKIFLTKGHEAIVDIDDYERLIKFPWSANVGRQVRAFRMSYRAMIYMHYEVLEIAPSDIPGFEVSLIKEIC